MVTNKGLNPDISIKRKKDNYHSYYVSIGYPASIQA
jgi:hypothetical protein